MVESILARGVVRFDRASPSFENADVIVRLEDVSVADAVAHIVAATTIHGVSKPQGEGTPIPFALRAPVPLDRRRQYSIRVHVDVDRSGRVEAGDFVSTQSYPVRSGETPGLIEVFVKHVT